MSFNPYFLMSCLYFLTLKKYCFAIKKMFFHLKNLLLNSKSNHMSLSVLCSVVSNALAIYFHLVHYTHSQMASLLVRAYIPATQATPPRVCPFHASFCRTQHTKLLQNGRKIITREHRKFYPWVEVFGSCSLMANEYMIWRRL